MAYEYIIVQAGGKGTRLDYLSKNKPKALVPIQNLPMLFHLFKKFRDKKFIIIGDYKIDVLKKYLSAFADVKYLVCSAEGKKGTCAGIDDALKIIPNNESFALIWSDLILADDFEFPNDESNYIGLSKGFRCRWSYENGVFDETPSEEFGVAGFFLFKDRNVISEVPKEGEFVRWLQQNTIKFETLDLVRTKEYGLIEEYNKLETLKCRPFNKIEIHDNSIVKYALDEQGKKLAEREIEWYKKVKSIGFDSVPKIESYEPLTMEKINGKNIYEYDFTLDEKKVVLDKIVTLLDTLHKAGSCDVDYFSLYDAYITKTFDRLDKVRNLIPFSDERTIKINGRDCRNVFFIRDEISAVYEKYTCNNFKLIHGDCTFSNMMLKNDETPVLIDPRGYFGFTELYGDEAYDWAKLYYSIKGNYDQFNTKRFRLEIDESEVNINIESNKWECAEQYFFELLPSYIKKEHIKFIHAIIWLSLTTYAWEDYDSICGAFYNGLYYMEEVL